MQRVSDTVSAQRSDFRPLISALTFATWLVLHGWSLYSLVTFRSTQLHGPDMVGEEVSGFAVPLVVAFAASMILLVIHRRGTSTAERLLRATPCATLIIAGLQIVAYFWFVIR